MFGIPFVQFYGCSLSAVCTESALSKDIELQPRHRILPRNGLSAKLLCHELSHIFQRFKSFKSMVLLQSNLQLLKTRLIILFGEGIPLLVGGFNPHVKNICNLQFGSFPQITG